jgi:hypothetical protein
MTVKVVLRMPEDIKTWLLEQARYNGATLGAEVSRSCRMRMEADAAKDRKAAATAE